MAIYQSSSWNRAKDARFYKRKCVINDECKLVYLNEVQVKHLNYILLISVIKRIGTFPPPRPSSKTDLVFPCYQINGSYWLVIFVYLSSLLVAHLSDAPIKRLVVMGDSARIQDKTTENSAWFFIVLGV